MAPERVGASSPPANGFRRIQNSWAGRRETPILLIIGCALVTWACTFVGAGVNDPRIANPSTPVPSPETRREWLGTNVHDVWIPLFYASTLAAMALMVAIFVRHRRTFGRHHAGLPLFLVLYFTVIWDPIANWAIYASYDPELLHWPVNWPLMNIAPTVEPVWILMGAYQMFFLAVPMLLIAVFNSYIVPRSRISCWHNFRQRLALFVFASALGAGADFLMEMCALNLRVFTYTQLAGPTLTWGHGTMHLWEIVLVGLIIGVATTLLHRDDRGRTVAARWVPSWTPFQRLGIGEAAVAAVTVGLCLMLYTAFWAVLRVTDQADHVVTPWAYPSTKVYDPDGRLKAAGIPGPYFVGTWCTGSACSK